MSRVGCRQVGGSCVTGPTQLAGSHREGVVACAHHQPAADVAGWWVSAHFQKIPTSTSDRAVKPSGTAASVRLASGAHQQYRPCSPCSVGISLRFQPCAEGQERWGRREGGYQVACTEPLLCIAHQPAGRSAQRARHAPPSHQPAGTHRALAQRLQLRLQAALRSGVAQRAQACLQCRNLVARHAQVCREVRSGREGGLPPHHK